MRSLIAVTALLLVMSGAAAAPAAAQLEPGATADLASQFGARWDGAASNDLLALQNTSAGAGAAGAGDVNGDGVADVVMGAYGADPYGLGNAGAAYVQFGPVSPGTHWLRDVATAGILINGAARSDQAGAWVNPAGDVNGDGLDDVVVEAPRAFDTLGGTYIVFGSPLPRTVDLAALGDDGIAVIGAVAYGSLTASVNAAGDVNGDGLDDVAFGAASENSAAGSAYVLFGRREPGIVLAADLAATGAGLHVVAAAPRDGAGSSVAPAGDIDSDGLDDIAVGAWKAGGTGRVYVIAGRRAGGTIDLGDPGAVLTTIEGTSNSDLGYMVSAGGDLDHDGTGDLLVSAPRTKVSAIVFGDDGTRMVRLGSLGADGFSLTGARGPLVAAGDVDGDGNGDVIVGNAATQTSPSAGPPEGEAYVVYGPFSPGALDVGSLGERGARIVGPANGSYAGQSVGTAANLDGSGADEALVGAYGAANRGPQSGSLYVLGSTAPARPELTMIAAPTTATPGQQVEFAVLARNAGTGGATSVALTDILPAGFATTAVEASQRSCPAPSPGTLHCALGTLAPGGETLVVVRGVVADDAPETLVNRATLSGPIPRAGDPSASAAVTVARTAPAPSGESDLRVDKRADRATATIGAHIDYTVTLHNAGDGPTGPITMPDLFSQRVRIISAEIEQGDCNRERPLVCRTAPLAAGERRIARIRAVALEPGLLINGAAGLGDAAARAAEPGPLRTLANVDGARVLVRRAAPRIGLRISPRVRTVGRGDVARTRVAVRARRATVFIGRVCMTPGRGLRMESAPGARIRHGRACWAVDRLARGSQRRFTAWLRVRGRAPSGPRLVVATARAPSARLARARATVRVPAACAAGSTAHAAC